MFLTSGEQHILVVLFLAHVLLGRCAPAGRAGTRTAYVAAAMGIITALCFFEPAGILAGLLIAAGYLVIHWFAAGAAQRRTAAFVGVHGASILLLMTIVGWSGGAESGRWLEALAGPPLQAIAALTGLLFMWWIGSTAVGLLVKELCFDPVAESPSGIPNAGALIGQLERTLILFLVLADVASGIGLLVAAKSILRFGEVKDAENRKMAEYVLIGTLASFTFAIPVAYATAELVKWAQ
ncbi:MAG: hypothetical protein ACOX9R_13450 [Armatimonadota bacterium]